MTDQEDTFKMSGKRLSEELFRQCRRADPGSSLTSELQNYLKKLTLEEREKLVNKTKHGCSPLLIACDKECVPIAEHLITTCKADMELRGLGTEIRDGELYTIYATPLWFAAYKEDFDILSLLIRHGADINSVTDEGDTALIAACCENRMNMIQFLVEHRADVNKPTWCGTTCLMLAVSRRICTILLNNGANINACNHNGETALISAARFNRREKTKLLLSRRANVHLRNRQGDDALQMASIEGNKKILSILLERVLYPNMRIAEAHELMGCAIINKSNKKKVYKHWSTALELREDLKKVLSTHNTYFNMTEFQTQEELKNCALDMKLMERQSLFICERILGRFHPHLIDLVISQCVAYLDDSKYLRQMDLWTYATELVIQSEGMLGEVTSSLIADISYLVLVSHYDQEPIASKLKFHIFNIVQMLANKLTETMNLLQLKPVFQEQQVYFDMVLNDISNLIFILDELFKGEDSRVRSLIKNILQRDPRTSTGNSLLHMAVSKKRPYDHGQIDFTLPKYRLTTLLCECGAKVDSRNSSDVTPLHIASSYNAFDAGIVDILLRFGSHVDWKDSKGNTPLVMLRSNGDYPLCEGNYLNLKCLTARKVKEHLRLYKDDIPDFLVEFVDLH